MAQGILLWPWCPLGLHGPWMMAGMHTWLTVCTLSPRALVRPSWQGPPVGALARASMHACLHACLHASCHRLLPLPSFTIPCSLPHGIYQRYITPPYTTHPGHSFPSLSPSCPHVSPRSCDHIRETLEHAHGKHMHARHGPRSMVPMSLGPSPMLPDHTSA